MSSDVMFVCQEDESNFYGKNSDKALFIDEASMGCPWHDFGGYVSDNWCGIPSVFAQMTGDRETRFKLLTLEKAKELLDKAGELETHESFDAETFKVWVVSHIGKHVATENW